MAKIVTKRKSDTLITRLVIHFDESSHIDNAYGYKPKIASKVLNWALNELIPMDHRSRYLVTCGGFINADLPSELADVKVITSVSKKEINAITNFVESICHSAIDITLLRKLSSRFEYLTLGFDLFEKNKRMREVQLVTLIDLQKNLYHWTGKFYPTPSEEKCLIRFPELSSQFIKCGKDRVFVMGCHDLSAFNPRCQKRTGGWKRELRDEIQNLAQSFKPNIALQHPHNTITYRTWNTSWSGLKGLVPTVTDYVSGIRYGLKHENKEMTISDVCEHSMGGNVMDFMIREAKIKTILK